MRSMSGRAKSPLSGFNRRPLVAAVLSDYSNLFSDIGEALRSGASALELRADFFPKTILNSDALHNLMSKIYKSVRLPIIFTLRSGEEGGHLSPRYRELDRLSLFRAVLADVDIVDIELTANEINRHVVLEAHKRGRAVILSYHNFQAMPPDTALKRLVKKARHLRGDILKVAAKASTKEDADRLMDFCRRVAFRNKIFLPMGAAGAAHRLDGFWYGSGLTYGFVRHAVAPGQLAVREVIKAQKELIKHPPVLPLQKTE